MNKIIKFDIDKMAIRDEVSDDHLAILEVYVCHTQNNAHNYPISLEALENATPTLFNKFFVADFNGKDFMGHEKDEMIIGFFPKENNMRFSEEDKDGKVHLIAEVIMSKIYAQWAYNIFLKGGNERPVSMEIDIIETEVKEDGLEWLTNFVFRGVTVLGLDRRPACEKSNAKIIKFSEILTNKEMKKDYKKAIDEYKYSKIDFSIPENVKNIIENELKINKNLNVVDVNFAKYLIKNDNISLTKINQLINHFEKTKVTPNCLGNNEGFEWINDLQNQINNIDNLEYFENDEESEKKEDNLVSKKDMIAKFATINDLYSMIYSALDSVKCSVDNYTRYSLMDFDGDNLYVYDYEVDAKFALPYTYMEDKIEINFDEIKSAKLISKWILDETEEEDTDIFAMAEMAKKKEFGCAKMEEEESTEEDKQETKEDEAKEDFSSDANTDATSEIAIQEENAEENAEISEEANPTLDEAKMEFENKIKELEAQNAELKAFKDSVDNLNKEQIVNQVLFSVVEGYELSDEKKEEFITKSKDFSIDKIEEWKTFVKIECFELPRKNIEATKFSRIDIPATHTKEKNTETKNGLWKF